jgi:mono/diheme cytochrome c family protein
MYSMTLISGRGFEFAAILAICGCHRAPQPEFQSSTQVQALKPELQEQVRKVLDQNCGTAERPKLMGAEDVSADHLLHGREVYLFRCVHCHGVTGDGQGEAAKWLNPRPRDYRRGRFKFTSTPFDTKPLRSDLARTIRAGIPGTSMPSFNLLPAQDIEAVIDYVLVLTHRGELEFQLAGEAEASEELAPDVVTELVGSVLAPWKEAQSNASQPLSAQPVFTAEHVALGKKAFLTRGCSKCHGEDGRGQTPENLRGDLKDFWGHPTKAADLTSGLLHGGHRPEDVYRRIFNGISGTPMPSFQTNLGSEPDTFWNLVSYVLYVSNRRRAGEIPEAGLMPTAGEQATAAGGQ